MFNGKARLWINGRTDIFSQLQAWRKENRGEVIWIHCASLGEFEQGRPIIERLRKEFPHLKIVLTFFSPSGFEIRKNYNGADYICYLPADTPINSKRFINILQPKVALIVKYEYWANYFFECKKRAIPLFIVSGILRKDQRFFGVFSFFWKKVLECVTHFFVQNEETKRLLSNVGLNNATISGDSRFDRVAEIAANAKPIDEIASFKQNSFCTIAGSSWPQEEKMLKEWIDKSETQNSKLILVPHEISESHIVSIQALFPNAVKWSERNSKDLSQAKTLIVDTIGLLSSIYQYGDVAIIGGGFGKGIHNTLEAAVWGIPVLFGPNFKKFEEAKQLVSIQSGFTFDNENELLNLLEHFRQNDEVRKDAGKRASDFIQTSKGATQIVSNYLKQNVI